MNDFEVKIALSLLFAGAFLAFLFLAKPKDRNPSHRGLFSLFLDLFRLPKHLAPPGKYSTPGEKKESPRSQPNPTASSPIEKKEKAKPTEKVMEVFDYMGVKILHEDGLWTVNEEGVVRVFKAWSDLPPRYQKMVKELDNRSIQDKKQGDYFLEILNGLYYVSTPGGKKKKYNRFSDIPEHIQKFLKQ